MCDGRSATFTLYPFNVIANGQDTAQAGVSPGLAVAFGFKPSA
jgi:hypothetical protein